VSATRFLCAAPVIPALLVASAFGIDTLLNRREPGHS
jgi:hypothetical protein